MAYKMAHAVKSSTATDIDDLKSVAHLALVEAAESYDPSRGVRFARFARYRIEGALKDCIHKYLTGGIVFQHPPRLLPEVRLDYQSLFSLYTPRAEELVDAVDWVDVQLKRLPKKTAEMCRMILVDGLSQQDVAGTVGLSESAVSQRLTNAFAKLRHTVTPVV